jgi:periplasmic divalent cation tolerance protein
MTAMQAAFCYVTCPTLAEAREIARVLVEERLAACGNILPNMESVYRWQGAVHDAHEVVLILKTRRSFADRVILRVKEVHSYQCPCVAILPVDAGNEDYLAWIVSETVDAA